MKPRFTLQTNHLVLILSAMCILPLSFPIASLFVYIPALVVQQDELDVYNSQEVEESWHAKAKGFDLLSDSELIAALEQTVEQYKTANVFWIDEKGKTRFISDEELSIPDVWDPSYTVSFMKASYDRDPFTVVAFIGESTNDGFVVLQIDRTYMDYPIKQIDDYFEYIYFAVVALLLFLFLILSWLFFRSIRKRIVRLQSSMEVDHHDIPNKVVVGEMDEIGALEESFNQMIDRLTASRRREQEEEKLRKDLIANLSHDLRTPLATIRAHTYSLQKEELSMEGNDSITIIDQKIDHLHTLIENLLSYTLLTSGRYTLKREKVDVNRIIRMTLKAWYPFFEKEQFVVDIALFEETVYWQIDRNWFERILDNLFQNVLRHAKSGKYIRITCKGKTITIEDKGPGMKGTTDQSGVGIGLTIVELMIKEMEMSWEIDSSTKGTVVTITKHKV
ncbi:HAMP domain-containing sensor histidine kinase [Bacillus suaedae]|uniref:histidine kinase n=1 Tax=Halalkalibacter suaedae TaxID=2822140 RepID=A0A941ANG2_9BACI|nr:HAMP domain-containing sensor histidine kinase [Bacillus suaedae]MBP3951595.1 HAMP domain-containing histidine kinase [Bacillus suaedae]